MSEINTLKLKPLIKTEIHITTRTINEDEIQRFIEFSKEIDCKPIIIELEKGDCQQQPMISYKSEIGSQADLLREIDRLKNKFKENDFDILRVKVEILAEDFNLRDKLNPNYYSGYFEWHCKLLDSDIEKLKEIYFPFEINISRNRLKNEEDRRFITHRNAYTTYEIFKSVIGRINNVFISNDITPVKTESEYCIYDSNRKLDFNWINTLEITDTDYIRLLAAEKFVKSADEIQGPFMLQGSILTRQFYNHSNRREVGDIDYIYIGDQILNPIEIGRIFSKWVIDITKGDSLDKIGIRLNDFSGNDFWRRIDYAMHDDFPTTNTDIHFKYGDYYEDIIGLDISWNLPIHLEPETVLYNPQLGESFQLKNTTPLPLQVSWKLHQSVVRPREKDIEDLNVLIGHLVGDQVQQMIKEYKSECDKDKIDWKRVFLYINNRIVRSIEKPLDKWAEIDYHGNKISLMGLQSYKIQDDKRVVYSKSSLLKELFILSEKLGRIFE